MFFTSDSWLFYYEDTLIQLYPLPLWQGAVVHLGVVILAELVILYLVAWLINRRAPADKLIQRA